MNDLSEVTRQRDEAQKACAEMRDCLERAFADGLVTQMDEWRERTYAALSNDSGKDYAPTVDLEPTIVADAERFGWLIRQGVAWRDCYSLDPNWLSGEWLYEAQDARNVIDSARLRAAQRKET